MSESTFVKMPHCWKSHVTPYVLYSRCQKQCLVEKEEWAIKVRWFVFFQLLFYTKSVKSEVEKCMVESFSPDLTELIYSAFDTLPNL